MTLLGVNRLTSVYKWTRPEVDQGSFSCRGLLLRKNLRYAVSVGQPGDQDSSIEGFSVTSALWRLKGRRFTPDKYTHQTKN